VEGDGAAEHGGLEGGFKAGPTSPDDADFFRCRHGLSLLLNGLEGFRLGALGRRPEQTENERNKKY
jgi:hypothetical protein